MTQPDDLHPYDNKDRRFRHDDVDPSQRLRASKVIARVLALPSPPPSEGLRYNLSFYSGGLGIVDRLAITFPCSPAEVDAIVARLQFVTPEIAVTDAAAREGLENLVLDEDEPQSLRTGMRAFVEKERAEFQPPPGERSRVWFSPDSGVNFWSLVYEQDGLLHFIDFDQG